MSYFVLFTSSVFEFCGVLENYMFVLYKGESMLDMWFDVVYVKNLYGVW